MKHASQGNYQGWQIPYTSFQKFSKNLLVHNTIRFRHAIVSVPFYYGVHIIGAEYRIHHIQTSVMENISFPHPSYVTAYDQCGNNSFTVWKSLDSTYSHVKYPTMGIDSPGLQKRLYLIMTKF